MIATFSDAFGRVVAPQGAWAVQQLELFTGLLPEGEWSADLTACRYRQGGTDLRVGLLGTFSEPDASWLWGWANPGFRGAPVTAAAGRLRELGVREEVPELSGAMVRLDGFPDPRWAAETLAFAAMALLGAPGYVGVEAAPGSRAYLVADDPSLPRAAPDAVTLPRVLMRAVELLDAPARAVVAGYFRHHGLPVHEAPDGIGAALPSGSTAQVSFDALGRIASVRVVAVGSPA